MVAAVAIASLSLAAHGLFVNRFYQARAVLETATVDIADIEADLIDLGSSEALLVDLEEATQDLDLLVAQFPARRSVPETLESVIGIAETHGLTVASAKSQPGEDRTLGGRTYSNLQIDVELQGSVSALSNFLADIEGGAISAATIEELAVSTLEDDEALPNGSESASKQSLRADLTVSIFSRDFSIEAKQLSEDDIQ